MKTWCGKRSKYGSCTRPPHADEVHAIRIGGGGDPFDRDPDLWFVWGKGIVTEYLSARITVTKKEEE